MPNYNENDGRNFLKESDNLITQNQLNEALRRAKQAFSTFKQLKDQNAMIFINGKILFIQALMHHQKENLQNASRAALQSLTIFTKIENKKEIHKTAKFTRDLFMDLGKKYSLEKNFEKAAKSFEEAASMMKLLDNEIKSLETRAKAYILRAASVRDPNNRKKYLSKAVLLFKESNINDPLLKGHVEYYSALVDKINDPMAAIKRLGKAIEHYKKIDSKAMLHQAMSLLKTIEQSFE